MGNHTIYHEIGNWWVDELGFHNIPLIMKKRLVLWIPLKYRSSVITQQHGRAGPQFLGCRQRVNIARLKAGGWLRSMHAFTIQNSFKLCLVEAGNIDNETCTSSINRTRMTSWNSHQIYADMTTQIADRDIKNLLVQRNKYACIHHIWWLQDEVFNLHTWWLVYQPCHSEHYKLCFFVGKGGGKQEINDEICNLSPQHDHDDIMKFPSVIADTTVQLHTEIYQQTHCTI